MMTPHGFIKAAMAARDATVSVADARHAAT
jgi:hypothetical protein